MFKIISKTLLRRPIQIRKQNYKYLWFFLVIFKRKSIFITNCYDLQKKINIPLVFLTNLGDEL